MKCPYCAEEIQDDAIVCRYCHAVKENGAWIFPIQEKSGLSDKHKKTRTTTRTASAFFIMSGIAETYAISAPVQVFGDVQSGGIALAYHLIFMSVYFSMGIGLWVAKPWSYLALWIGTGIYSLDRIMALFTNQETTTLLAQYEPILGPSAQSTINMVIYGAMLLSLASWWGFMFYIYLKREYFQGPESR